MIRRVVEASLRLRILVITAAAVVMIVGIGRMHRMPVDVLPEFAPPYIEIQTEAPCLSANEVEGLVTLNVEHLFIVPSLYLRFARPQPVGAAS